MRIEPCSRFSGQFLLPGDKSISHRAALLGALATGTTRITNYSSAADCASTLRCLEQLGVGFVRDGTSVAIDAGGPQAWHAPGGPLDAGNSGSTLRMLAGPLAGQPFLSVLTGDQSLRRRPVERVAEPLRAMGARVLSTHGRPPLTIEGATLRGITWETPVASAQVKTAVLLAGLLAEGETTVREPAQSRDHTERMLPAFGVEVARSGLATTVRGGQALRGAEVRVPSDASSASFLVVAALVLPDSEVRLDGVLLSPTRTAFIDVLREMGGQVETRVESTDPEPVGTIVARTSSLRGIAVDPALAPSLIDEVPALAVAAAHASGSFVLSGAAELRLKESDRIAAMAEGLSLLGTQVTERPDGLLIEGGRPLRGASVRAHDDHRIAMALSVAALTARGATELEGAECVAVSFPQFFDILARGAGRG